MSQQGHFTIRQRAERRAAKQLESLSGRAIFRESPAGYTKHPEDNLIRGVGIGDFSADLTAGAGNELQDGSRDPAKFCASFSSSALAVNAFGPFRNHPHNLELLGFKGFVEAQFEKPLPTGLRGTDPHLDFFVAGPAHIVSVESKFLEPLWPKMAKFADSYEGAINSLAEPAWQAIYRELKNNPRLFSFLDAAQLVKHYLGIRNTLGVFDAELDLLYVYWEPNNAGEHGEYCRHREEVAYFTGTVNESQVKFVALSYRELWEEWRESSLWSGMAAHLSNLEQRYSFSI